MRRLPLIDAVLLGTLLPLWLGAAALHIRQVARGNLGHLPVYVARSNTAGGYPVVSGLFAGHGSRDLPLEQGDVLLALGEIDLRDYGPYGFFAAALELDAGEASVPVTYLHRGQRRVANLSSVPVHFPWRMLPLTAGLVATGAIILVRRPGVPVARAFFLAAVALALHWTWFFGDDRTVNFVWMAVYLLVSTAMFPLVLLVASMFPEEAAPKGPLPRWPWLFAVTGPIMLTASVGAPMPPQFGLRGIALVNVVFIAALLAVLTRNYRRAGTVGRRQLKWAVLGHYVGLGPVVAADVVTLFEPAWWWLHELAVVAEIAIPVCILIALVRYNLYDVDRLITATVASSVLFFVLLWAVLVVVPPVAGAGAALLDVDPQVGTAGLSGLVAVLLVSLYRRLNPMVDRMLFRERYALRERVDALLESMRGSGEAAQLLHQVRDGLATLFRASRCVVYRRDGDLYLPVHAGRNTPIGGSPPPLQAKGSLVNDVLRAKEPLDLDEWRKAQVKITPEDSDAAQQLAPSLLVSAEAGDTPTLIALGPKESGDAYSSADLAIVSAVTRAAAVELRRVDEQRRTAAKPILVPSKYEVLGEIGRGGMGVVYKVRHVGLEMVRALKILPEHLARDPVLVARFHREAKVMAQLRHEHIVRVFDVDEESGLHYFVMEYVDGQPLSEILRERQRLDLDNALAIVWQVGSALQHAHTHELGVVHRDIKPSNILIERSSARAVVTDFGIAKAAGGQLTAVATAGALGTVDYCSPEQLRGDMDIDLRADVYSLGIVMYEMVTGRPLFAGLEPQEIVGRVLYDQNEYALEFGPEIPDAYRGIVARAVAKDRRARYPNLGALLDDLASLRQPAAAASGTRPAAAPSGVSIQPLQGQSADSDAALTARAPFGRRSPRPR